MIERRDISFAADRGDILRGWIFEPAGRVTDAPAVSLCHGFAGVKEHRLEQFARAFAEAGLFALVHDHRNFGSSDGAVRGDIDPWQQIEDWRRALSFLEATPGVDPKRIGIWGTSYSGGHALVLAATDRRVKAVVSQVPTISGFTAGRRRINPDATTSLEDAFDEDERAQSRGHAPTRQAVVTADSSVMSAYRSKEAIDFYLQPLPEGAWRNEVTLRSTRRARMYEPDAWISRVSPVPLLMIVANADVITLTDLQLDAYERANQPKKLLMLNGGHFAAYGDEFPRASGAAVQWFKEQLSPRSSTRR